jgi:hypothetical protein
VSYKYHRAISSVVYESFSNVWEIESRWILWKK